MSFPRFHVFWAINAPLEPVRLRRQLEQFRAIGFDGVVWHPRFYPNVPPYLGDRYLAELSAAILHAKKIGLAFWLYDENGWPSGMAGGQLLKNFPADAQRWAELVTQKPEHCLAEFERDGRKWFLAERVGAGVDYFNPDFTRHFLELTHERYHAGLAPEAWRHVEVVFCDEPEFGLGHAYDSLSRHGAIPWTPQLPGLFRQRFGEDLPPQVAKLFFADGNFGELRIKFWELLTDVFNSSFTAPVGDWCRRHGKLFTAHVKGEEHPLFQVPTSGSCHQFFRHLALPAIDALERHPGNNFYPRQVSSAARQFGNGRCMVEAFGGAGWGATPEDLETYLCWLGRHGLTDFVLHLSQYRLDSAAMRDWPPSQPLHLTWREAYPALLRRVRAGLEKNPRPAADTLIVAPNRGIMADYEPREFLQTNIHNAATYPATAAGKINRRFLEQVEELHRAGMNFDVADERTLEQFGQVSADRLALGKCNYRRVIVPEGCVLNEITRTALQAFQSGTPVSAPARIEIREEAAGLATGAPISVPWQLAAHPLNSLLLEPAPQTDGVFIAQFETLDTLPDASLQLVFADAIAALTVNGRDLPLEFSDEGSVARLAGMEITGANLIRFRAHGHLERPFVWLKGFFRVQSRAPFVAGPNHTLKTEGGFTVQPVCETLDRDLIADGFPFLQTSLNAITEIELPDQVSALQLAGVEADAVRLFVAGQDCGWSWCTNGEIRFAVELVPGRHRLQIELVPNTFNGFGPHHYYGGDWRVISPDQMKGVRNFADPVDAPAGTHVQAWHFRRFQLPASLALASQLQGKQPKLR